MPAKICLKLMSVMGSNDFDTKRHFPDGKVKKIDCILLGKFAVYFQNSNPFGIINGSILKSSDRFMAFID